MSGINVYRSRDNGPYYKIKTIYTGDNDTTQHDIDDFKWGQDVFYWGGGPSAAVSSALDAHVFHIDGFAYDTQNGTLDNDESGYNRIQFGTTYTDGFHDIYPRTQSTMNPNYYGAKVSGVFNKERFDLIALQNGINPTKLLENFKQELENDPFYQERPELKDKV